MGSGPPSRGEKSESKTSGRAVKRNERTKADDQSTGSAEEKPHSKRNERRNKMNGSKSFSGKSIDSEKAVGGSSKKITESRSVAFGQDFIPFDLSESSDEEENDSKSGKDRKGKQKAIEDEYLSDRERVYREKGKDRDVPPWRRGFLETSEREVDHGKREHDRGDDRQSWRDGNKRKYDEYQGDDRNQSRNQRFDSLSNKCPWLKGVDLEKCRNVAEMFHCEVEPFVNWICPTPVEDEIRGLVVDHIARSIKGPFPDAQVFPFGSYMTKLYLPTGDIDLVVLSDMMAHNDKTKVLHVIAVTLKRCGITSHVTIIAKAKVPIVKFISTYGRFQVDISINQNNGLVAGNVISGFLKQMVPSAKENGSKALKSLIMITKAFLSQRKLNEVYTGGLGSYSVVCLAVSFLQMHPKIRRGEIDPEKNLGVLVIEFFELYGHRFNYENVGISIREGGTYFNKSERGWNINYKKNMLSIEDPADPSNDISSGSYHFHKVRMAFAGAYDLLTTTSYNRVGILSSRHQGTAHRLRQRYEPEDLSILSTIMWVSQETINHRRLVQELHDQRTLHRILGVEPRNTGVRNEEVRKHQPSRHKLGTSSQDTRRVESAWTKGRLQDDSDYDDDHHRGRLNSHDQDGGRYDIGRHNSKKRRKVQRSDDDGVYFVAEADSRGDLSEGELEEIEDDASEVYKEHGRVNRQTDRHKRRDFWLAKAMQTGLVGNSA